MRRTALVVGLLFAASALTGCLALRAAYVPGKFLEGEGGNGWRQNFTASDREPQNANLGLSSQQTLAYEDPAREGRGHPGSLRVTTVRSLLTPSEASLSSEVQKRVQEWALESGVKIERTSATGSRALANGATSLYFVYNGSVSREDGFFDQNTRVKILGEIFQCRGSRTSVAAVGLAQFTKETTTRNVAGFPVSSSSSDLLTWQEIVGDPKGTIEGQRGTRALAYNLACI